VKQTASTDQPSLSCSFQRLLREVPDLSLAEALCLFDSKKADESYLGLIVLFRRYPNVLDVWSRLVQSLIERPATNIPPALIYFLAHIPWHGDIAYSGEPLQKTPKFMPETSLRAYRASR